MRKIKLSDIFSDKRATNKNATAPSELDTRINAAIEHFKNGTASFAKTRRNDSELHDKKPIVRILEYSAASVAVAALLLAMIFIFPRWKSPESGVTPDKSASPVFSPTFTTGPTVTFAPHMTAIPKIVDSTHDQVADYLRKALQSSLLVRIDKTGKIVSEEKLSNADFATAEEFSDPTTPISYDGTLTPDGKHMLMRYSFSGPAEYMAALYKVIDMETGAEYFPSTQSGRNLNLRILDNNLIGSASGDSVELFDIHFQPHGVTLDISGIYTDGDSGFTGISYDSSTQRYIVTNAYDATLQKGSAYSGTFSVGIYIFDKTGKLFSSKTLPAEYLAVMNQRSGMTYNNPIILDHVWILVYAQPKAQPASSLLVNTATWEMRKIDYSKVNMIDETGIAFATKSIAGRETYFIITIKDGVATQKSEITSPPVTPDYNQEFTFFSPNNAGRRGDFYILANGQYYANNVNFKYSGLFYQDGTNSKLIQLLPSNSFCHFIGVDLNGNALIFIPGANDHNRSSIEKALGDFAIATGK